MGDKAISAGEDSDILVSNSVIGAHSNIAVTSKDGSETIISNSPFLNDAIALNGHIK